MKTMKYRDWVKEDGEFRDLENQKASMTVMKVAVFLWPHRKALIRRWADLPSNLNSQPNNVSHPKDKTLIGKERVGPSKLR